MFITMVIIFIIVASVWLTIYGGSQNKTDEERKMEDEEQMKYLKEYKEKKNKKVEN